MRHILFQENIAVGEKTPFVMMVGIPGSGKSTAAEKLSEDLGAHIHSSDAIREELFGDPGIQGDPHQIFSLLKTRISRDLSSGIPVIMDATNLHSRHRKNFLQDFSTRFSLDKRCILAATSFGRCRSADQNRDRQVGEAVLLRMRAGFQMPMYSEGWDSIDIIYPYSEQGVGGDADTLYLRYMDYDQHNRHHSSTLGEHLLRTRQYLIRQGITDPVLLQAAGLHDLGKAYTQAFGEDGEAHYYGHDSVGAYESLFLSGITDPLEVGALIACHMMPYQWKKNAEGTYVLPKTANSWTPDFVRKVLLLHEADENSHL